MNYTYLCALLATEPLWAGAAEQQPAPPPPAFNPPGRPPTERSQNLFVTFDALYWEVHENGMPFAIKQKAPSTTDFFRPDTGSTAHQKVENLDFDWNWGWRAGLGYNLPYDGWDLTANWTHLHSTAHGKSTAPEIAEEQLLGLLLDIGSTFFGGPISRCNRADAHWKSHFDIGDLELGRQYKVSSWLMLRPFAGFRTAWIDQTYDIDYRFAVVNLPTSVIASGLDQVRMKNDSWGLGLRGGLDTQWKLGDEWAIYGNVALSILYGFYNVERSDDSSSNLPGIGPIRITEAMKDSLRISRAIADLALGIRWDYLFNGNRSRLGLKLGWEHHVFFGQNQFLQSSTFAGILYRSSQNNGDETVSGWTFAAQFDF